MKKWPDHLPLGSIHLWICRDLLSPRWDETLEMLGSEEKERARNYRFAKDRRRYLGSALLQRCVLAHYASCSLRDQSFSRNQWGKPFLMGAGEAIQFNVSRSHEVALLAVSGGCEIGVDVEYEVDCSEPAMSVASQFSEAEQSYIENASDAARALFEIWARKEAYIKGIGRGLSHPLNGFDVSPGGKVVRDWSKDRPADSWAVHSVELPVSGYAAAIATPQVSPSIELMEVNIDDLFERAL